MIAFKDGDKDILFIIGGYGITPLYRQSGVQYEQAYGDHCKSNEQHMFTLNTSE